MDLASKNPTGGPNCDARHDATDIPYGHFARLPSSLRPRSQQRTEGPINAQTPTPNSQTALIVGKRMLG